VTRLYGSIGDIFETWKYEEFPVVNPTQEELKAMIDIRKLSNEEDYSFATPTTDAADSDAESEGMWDTVKGRKKKQTTKAGGGSSTSELATPERMSPEERFHRIIMAETLQTDYKTRVQNRLKRYNEYDKAKPLVQGWIMEHVSEELKMVLKAQGKWEAITADRRDPIKFLKEVMAGAATVVHGRSLDIRRAIRLKIDHMKQAPEESLESYFKRACGLYQENVIFKVGFSDDEDLAMVFIEGLDKTRYSQVQLKLYSDRVSGNYYIHKNLADAFQAVSNLTPKMEIRRPKSNKIAMKTSVPAVAEGKKEGTNVVEHSHEKKREFWGNCYKCGKKGHRASDCTADVSAIAKLTTSDALPRIFKTAAGSESIWDIGLDTQANITIFTNKELVTNIREIKRPVNVQTMNGRGEIKHYTVS
jgi:hypothetical protein